MKIEEYDGIIDIEGIDDSHAFVLYQDAFEILCWLDERRQELYQASKGDEQHISYQEAQRRHLCPACGDQGVLFSGPERDDADFQAYMCPNEHIFYISRDLC